MSEVFTAGLVGCGPRGLEHAEALAKAGGFKLCGVADPNGHARSEAAQRFGVPGFPGAKELAEATRPQILIAATPPQVRGDALLPALGDGLRALVVEKPLAPSVAEAKRLLAACGARGVKLLAVHQLRLCSEFDALQRALDEGQLGEPRVIRASCHGNLPNQGIHLLDLIRRLAGARKLLWIDAHAVRDAAALDRFATAETGCAPDAQHPGPMWARCELAFEGGLRAELSCGALYARGEPFVDDWLQKRITVEGSEGFAEALSAGGFRMLTARAPGWQAQPGSLDDYRAATARFHERLRVALREDTPHPCEAAEDGAALETLGWMAGCASSAREGRPAAPPFDESFDALDAWRLLSAAPGPASPSAPAVPSAPATPAREPSAAPDVSFVVSVVDNRGNLAACLKGLLGQQLRTGRRYEVVLADHGRDAARMAQMKEALRPCDKLVVHDTDNELELYHRAAGAASGRILLLTEPHCIPEPDCVQELIEHFERHPETDGVALRSTPIARNAMARMEQRWFEASVDGWNAPGNWRKVQLRGFAVKRRTYEAVGGLQFRYLRFAEWEFGARLQRAGVRLGYAPGAAIRHIYPPTVPDFHPHVEDWITGECRYRDEVSAEQAELYFGLPSDWNNRRSYERATARRLCGLAWQALCSGAGAPLRRRIGLALAMVGAFARKAPYALWGARARRPGIALGKAAARLRMRAWQLISEDRMAIAYWDFYLAVMDDARMRYLARHPAPRRAAPRTQHVDMANYPGDCLEGFHPREESAGRAFRWSSELAVLRVDVPAGAWKVSIDTGALRGAGRDFSAALFVNGRRVPDGGIRMAEGVLTFDIPEGFTGSAAPEWLGIACRPLPRRVLAKDERRKLGIPIARVTFEPLKKE
ncbi:MAG: Gfo/Idh/MocA family oxidoreductase [Planctomycetes bacterium]|nr:Gfo/Idh/MocA family oxidoreductase [Planctomycetota bacterium]